MENNDLKVIDKMIETGVLSLNLTLSEKLDEKQTDVLCRLFPSMTEKLLLLSTVENKIIGVKYVKREKLFDFIYEEERRIIYEMITIPTVILFWFFLTATCFIHEYIVIAYSTIHQPDIYLQILNMIKGFKGNILNNFENVLKHIYDITPILSSDDEDINKISFPEVLENFENRKEKVDLALENSKFLYINI